MPKARWPYATVAALILLGWFSTLVRFVPLKTTEAARSAQAFNASDFAGAFWTNRLLPSSDKAVNAQVLLPAILADPAGAKKQFSHGGGMGGEYFYFVSGEGKILAIDEGEISLTTSDSSTNADIVLQTGLIFGDAVRDGTGLLNVNEFSNSQDFNEISTALNHIVETSVLPAMRQQAKPGGKIRFTGCAQVEDDGAGILPLKVVPIACRLEAN